MKYCFPADISVIPLSDSQIIMYAADVYGQVWRIRYDYFADLSNDYTSASSAKWTVKRIFTANPGSGLASGNAEAFPTNTLVSTDADVRCSTHLTFPCSGTIGPAGPYSTSAQATASMPSTP